MRPSLRRKRGGGATAPTATLSLYYASDVHGSEACWRKFLGAARFYGADALIMGGDLTGKAIVPIERGDGVATAEFLGEEWVAKTPEELDKLLDAIRYNGMYPWLTSGEEIRRHRDDPAAREELFDTVMLGELRRWIEIADERMGGRDVAVYVMAGNDDPWSCDEILESADHVQACDDRLLRVGEHEMISCSIANPTPWHSPRELDENALYDRIKALADQVEEPSTAIFNLHVPPYDSGLDRARKIAEDLTVVHSGGQAIEIPVGSHAVRQIIEEYQPLLGLHGHIHESRGDARIGRTLCINSGSEYNTGRIHGVVVKLSADAVAARQFVVG